MGGVFVFCGLIAGCGDAVHLPTSDELAVFNSASPINPIVDKDRIKQTFLVTGPYRIVTGDLLDIQIPNYLMSSEASDTTTQSAMSLYSAQAMSLYSAHVDGDGMITVPIVGQLQVAGKNLTEAEGVIVNAFYPKYTKEKPPVVITVREYKTARVAISGAVTKTGIYDLRHDKMTLVGLLMESGGITDAGAAVIRITHQLPEEFDEANESAVTSECTNNIRLSFKPENSKTTIGFVTIKDKEMVVASQKLDIADKADCQMFVREIKKNNIACDLSKRLELLSSMIVRQNLVNVTTIALPVEGLNIPFKDVALQEGDRIEVERLNPEIFTVIGLVNKPGAYPYPSGVKYTLLQVIAFGGGLNEIADPHYVRVYRQAADGRVVDATFEITGTSLTAAGGIPIRPGDVVAVEQTARTKRNLLIAQLFQFRTGAVASYNYNIFEGKDYRRTD